MQGINEKRPNPICFFFLIHTVFQQNTKLPINTKHCGSW